MNWTQATIHQRQQHPATGGSWQWPTERCFTACGHTPVES